MSGKRSGDAKLFGVAALSGAQSVGGFLACGGGGSRPGGLLARGGGRTDLCPHGSDGLSGGGGLAAGR